MLISKCSISVSKKSSLIKDLKKKKKFNKKKKKKKKKMQEASELLSSLCIKTPLRKIPLLGSILF